MNAPAKRAKRLIRFCGLGLCAAALAACTPTDKRTPEEIVAQRAGERWAALVAADYEKAYGYFAPSLRAIRSLEGYKLAIKVKDGQPSPWKKYEVKSVQCEEKDICHAVVAVELELQIPKFAGMIATADAQEKWLVQDGQWYYYTDKPN